MNIFEGGDEEKFSKNNLSNPRSNNSYSGDFAASDPVNVQE